MPFKIFDTPLTLKKDKNGNFLKDKEGNYIQVPSMQDIQYLGALNTYYKRYLYINAFGITDGDVIDAMPLDDLNDKKKKKEALKVSPKQIEILLQYYKDDNLKKLLDLNKIEKIEDLPMSKANELISSIIKKGKKEEEK